LQLGVLQFQLYLVYFQFVQQPLRAVAGPGFGPVISRLLALPDFGTAVKVSHHRAVFRSGLEVSQCARGALGSVGDFRFFGHRGLYILLRVSVFSRILFGAFAFDNSRRNDGPDLRGLFGLFRDVLFQNGVFLP
jgi:hypothetical protein